MKNALCLFLVSLSYIVYGQNLDFEWAKQFGAAGANTSGRSITSDPWGNVFSLGTFKGSQDFDPGPGVFTLNSGTVTSTFISKLDSSGNFLWAGKLDIVGGSIISDKYGNVFVMGSLFLSPYDALDADPGTGIFPLWAQQGDRIGSCIVKLNNMGNLIWAKTFNTSANSGYCVGNSICLDSKQNIHIGGWYQNYAKFAPEKAAELNGSWVPLQSHFPYPVPSFFICSLDSLGNFRYAKTQSNYTGGYSIGYAICTQEDETISLVTNYRKNRLNKYEPEGLLIEKRDINGNHLWSKIFTSGTNPDQSSLEWGAAVTDKDGNVFATGYYEGTVDFDPFSGRMLHLRTHSLHSTSAFILKLNSKGNILKLAALHPAPNHTLSLRQLYTDREGSCYLAGALGGAHYIAYGSTNTNLTIGQNNGSLVKISKNLGLEWAMQIGENSPSRLNSICPDNFGNLYLSGSFSGTCDFSPTPATNNFSAVGVEDAYLLKLTGTQNFKMRTIAKDQLTSLIDHENEQLLLRVNYEVYHGKFRIIDINGKVICEKSDLNGMDFTMDLTGLQQGLYVVEISDDKHFTTTKIIKD